MQQARFKAGLQAFQRVRPAHGPAKFLFSANREDMAGYSADIYLDVTDVFDDHLELLRTHALMRERCSSFRYSDYYQALGQMRGCLGGYGKAVTLMHAHSVYAFSRQPGLLVEQMTLLGDLQQLVLLPAPRSLVRSGEGLATERVKRIGLRGADRRSVEVARPLEEAVLEESTALAAQRRADAW